MIETQKLIKTICDEENIKFKLVSKDWIMILEKDNKTRYITGYKFESNNHALGLICDDKYALYEVLSHFNIKVAEHYIVFKNYDRNKIIEYASKYNYHLVVKINEGTCGNDMYQVTNEEELFKMIDKLLVKAFSISLSPFYDIKNEYRSIIYKGNIELFYGKKRPIVIGNGKSTVYELLLEFNNNYFSKIKDHSNLDYILEKDKIYEYGWQHNLSKGAIPFYVEDNDIKSKIQNLALEVANKLNLNFVSVDIIELTNNNIMVLEINSGVMMENFMKIMDNGENISKEIYRKVISDLFKGE